MTLDTLVRTWRDLAACATPDVDPDWFFDPTQTEHGLAICATCPVTEACGQSRVSGDLGIWGGVYYGYRTKGPIKRKSKYERVTVDGLQTGGTAFRVREVLRADGGWLSVPAIVDLVGVQEKTVSRKLYQLRSDGWVEYRRRLLASRSTGRTSDNGLNPEWVVEWTAT